MKNKPEYANLRIAHGKDRCANPPRSGPQGASGGRRSNSGVNGSGEPLSATADGAELLDVDGEMADGDVGAFEDLDEAVAGGVVAAGPGEASEMHVDDGAVATGAAKIENL